MYPSYVLQTMKSFPRNGIKLNGMPEVITQPSLRTLLL